MSKGGSEDSKTGDGGLSRAMTLAAAAAGLVAYLYFLGGVVTWLRLSAAQLPGDAALAAVENTRLLSIGARVAAFEVALLLVVSGIVALLASYANKRRRDYKKQHPEYAPTTDGSWNDLWTLGGMIAPALAALLIVLGLSAPERTARLVLLVAGGVLGVVVALTMVRREPPSTSWWRAKITGLGRWVRAEGWRTTAVQVIAAGLAVVNVAVALLIVPALQGVILLAATTVIFAGPFLGWPEPDLKEEPSQNMGSVLIRSSGVWVAIAVSTAIAVAWVATPPVTFSRADLDPVEGAVTTAAYVGRNGDRVFVATCSQGSQRDTDQSRIRVFKLDAFQQLTVGGARYRFDVGGRPSLAQIVEAAVTTESPLDRAPIFDHALRGRSEGLCGS